MRNLKKKLRGLVACAVGVSFLMQGAFPVYAKQEEIIDWDWSSREIKPWTLERMREFPMIYRWLPDAPRAPYRYYACMELPEGMKAEFTGTIRYYSELDYFEDDEEYLTAFSNALFSGFYVKRVDHVMTEEEAREVLASIPERVEQRRAYAQEIGDEDLEHFCWAENFGLVYKLISEPEDADVNDDGAVGADDAQVVLKEYTGQLVGKAATFTDEQWLRADVTNDDVLGADDAQEILEYYVDSMIQK